MKKTIKCFTCGADTDTEPPEYRSEARITIGWCKRCTRNWGFALYGTKFEEMEKQRVDKEMIEND